MSTTLHDAFIRNLENQIEMAGITKSELARRMGCSRAFVSRLFGRKFVPGLEVIEKVARAIGVSAVSLLVEPAEQFAKN